MLLLSSGTAVFFSTVFVAAIVAIWSIPFLQYREEDIFLSEEERDYYRGRDMEKTTLIQILEERGWEKVSSDEEEVKLKTYPTLLHKLLDSQIRLTLEKISEEDDEEITVMKKNDEKIAKIKTEYRETDEGLEIHETTVSRSRVSPLYMEVVMFLTPEFEELTEEAAKEELESQGEEIDFGLKPYEFKKKKKRKK
jgi:hypothetical protein